MSGGYSRLFSASRIILKKMYGGKENILSSGNFYLCGVVF